MKISIGDPPCEGRYLAFIRSRSVQCPEWTEPVLVTYHGGRWHFGSHEIIGWFGPVPPMRVADVLAARGREDVPQAYDL